MHRNSLQVLSWSARVLAVFLRFQPLITLSLIAILASSNLVRLLVIFVPLKVIILVGSDSLPHYLTPYLQESQRDLLVAMLCIACIFLFASVPGLEMAAKALSRAGGRRALQRANEMALKSREELDVQTYYENFCQVFASFAFASAAIVLLFFLSPKLGLAFVLALITEYLFTAAAFSLTNPLRHDSLAGRIRNAFASYLATLSAINLLLGLFVLIAVLWFDAAQPFFLTLLSFLFLRQSLGALRKGLLGLVALSQKRLSIDPLVFRRYVSQPFAESDYAKTFRRLFVQPQREVIAAKLLLQLREQPDRFTMSWIDPVVPKLYLFHLAEKKTDGAAVRCYQLQIFSAKELPLIEHENVLFNYVARSTVRAAPLMVVSEEDIFLLRLLDAGSGESPSSKQWADLFPRCLIDLWSLPLPRPLLRAFRTSRSKLSTRLSSALVQRAEVSVSSDGDRTALTEFLKILPAVCNRLEELPVVIHNPHMNQVNSRLTNDGGVYFMTWTHWTLEPIGFGLPARLNDGALNEILGSVCSQRKVSTDAVSVGDLRLVQACDHLERALKKEAYKQALQQFRHIFSLIE